MNTIYKQHPQNATQPDWWQGAVIYQIYPRSFQDSNGDGIGDLKGIIKRLPYIEKLGVDAIWLSPFFKSPMKDFGYDVSDYCEVDPMFGTLDDFKQLVQEAHQLGLRVIIDQVLSHTSDQHQWFTESRQDKTNPKSDWYIWADAKEDGNPPNNWLSIFGGSAWHWGTEREQYYFHNFLTAQPDLNFHHEDVIQALFDAMKFWLDLGVDGFRLDTANFYYCDQLLRDNPPRGKPANEDGGANASNPYSWQHHQHDKSQPENIAFFARLRRFLDQYPGIMTVGELGDDDPVGAMIAYTEGGNKLNMTYTFKLLSEESSALWIHDAIAEYEDRSKPGAWPSWPISNHDVTRIATRWNANHIDALKAYATMQLCLKGSPCIYQGDELGLVEANLTFEQLQDPYGITMWPKLKGRDGCRTPMPWSHDQLHAGFSSADKPWLPVAQEHLPLSADMQSAADSLLSHYQETLRIRKKIPALLKGEIKLMERDANCFGFLRHDQDQTLLCVFNLSSETVGYKLPDSTQRINAISLPQPINALEQISPTHSEVTLKAWQFFIVQINL